MFTIHIVLMCFGDKMFLFLALYFKDNFDSEKVKLQLIAFYLFPNWVILKVCFNYYLWRILSVINSLCDLFYGSSYSAIKSSLKMLKKHSVEMFIQLWKWIHGVTLKMMENIDVSYPE